MKISLYPPLSINEIGKRDNQEDSLSQWDNRLFVLCDGMGGHEKGEVASQTVCQSLVKWFEQNVDPSEPFTDDQLCEAIEYAYLQLDQYADGSPKQMGTTLTLIYIENNGITAAHMGDSRIYHFRFDMGQTVLYISRDHSLAFDLYQAGEITYKEMTTFSQKNIVTRAMTPGKGNRMQADIIHITDIKSGDWFYLCSDGMLEQMDTKELGRHLYGPHSEEDEKKRDRLIAATANNQDNHSAWLIHIKDVIKKMGDDQLVNEEPTSRCNAINIIRQREKYADEEDVVIVEKGKKAKLLIERMKSVVDIIMNKAN